MSDKLLKSSGIVDSMPTRSAAVNTMATPDKLYKGIIAYISGETEAISFSKSSEIINAYLRLQKDRLKNDRPVQFFGLVKLAKSRDEEVADTIGTDSIRISNQTGIPVYTCVTVIQNYLRGIKEHLGKPGNVASITGICTFKSYLDGDKVCVRTNKTQGSYPTMRVFTSKFLASGRVVA
jgi:hypothetical protein